MEFKFLVLMAIKKMSLFSLIRLRTCAHGFHRACFLLNVITVEWFTLTSNQKGYRDATKRENQLKKKKKNYVN